MAARQRPETRANGEEAVSNDVLNCGQVLSSADGGHATRDAFEYLPNNNHDHSRMTGTTSKCRSLMTALTVGIPEWLRSIDRRHSKRT